VEPAWKTFSSDRCRISDSFVLINTAFVSNVSYVVAFRQTSILLGVVLSVTVLKEPAYTTKCVAVIVMFLGLLLVGAG
jgi:uncharacterized membrane protein